MARAKRTDRTEARRRHRAEQAALAEVESGDETATATASPSSAKGSTKGASRGTEKPAPAARPGIMGAFRGAYRPLNLRGDLAALPLIFSNLGFLAAMVGTAAIAVVFVLAYNDVLAAIPVGTATTDQLSAIVQTSTIPYFLGTMALQPPPVIGAFLIGFMAKRGSWLTGLVYGIFVVIVATLVFATPAGRLFTQDGAQGSTSNLVIGFAAWSPVGSALLASAAAWYRRFLDLSNPNRGQRGAKPQQGRGNTKAKAAR